MSTVAIVFHSGYGHTRKQAEAVRTGAASVPDVAAHLLQIDAGFTNSATINGDKLSTLTSLFTLAMQHGMIWVGTGMMPANTKAATRNDVNYLGSFSGLMAQSPSDASPEEGPLPGDLETARRFGARIARTVHSIQRSRETETA